MAVLFVGTSRGALTVKTSSVARTKARMRRPYTKCEGYLCSTLRVSLLVHSLSSRPRQTNRKSTLRWDPRHARPAPLSFSDNVQFAFRFCFLVLYRRRWSWKYIEHAKTEIRDTIQVITTTTRNRESRRPFRRQHIASRFGREIYFPLSWNGWHGVCVYVCACRIPEQHLHQYDWPSHEQTHGPRSSFSAISFRMRSTGARAVVRVPLAKFW